MAKPSSSKEVELHPDAWERFERAVDRVAKAPPQHRTKKLKKPKKRKSGERNDNVKRTKAKAR